MAQRGQTMKLLSKIGLGILFIYIISVSHAFGQGQINVQNGNINHFYQDFLIPGHGYALTLERSFNSLSRYNGKFGRKWGSNFDIDFNITPEGTVEITEFGGGFKTTFSREGYSQQDVERFIEKVYLALPPASRTEKIRQSLKKDIKLRHKLASDYKVSLVVSEGAKLFANDRGPETLEKIKKERADAPQWVRTFSDGKKEFFNTQGWLVRREDTNRNFLKLDYDSNGNLTKVTDTAGRQINFTYYPNKKIAAVTTPTGKQCLFKYDKEGRLISAKNARGYEFKHEYDSNHQMTKVSYPNGLAESMKYNAEGKVTYHEGPEDIRTRYSYDTQGDPNRFFFVTVTKEIGKKPNHITTVDKYEYEFGLRENGTLYTHKLASVLEGVRTETIYTPCCGKPVSINQNGKVTRFDYMPNGALKKKMSPDGTTVSLTYDEKFSKVAKVETSGPKLKRTEITEYKYDQKGNLAFATNKSKKIAIQLVYDTKGRIQKLVDQGGKTIQFNYNELGKPTKISLEGIGSIVVSYNAAGEITDVQSTGGRKIAGEVTNAFQTLLDIIRPAGVSLNI